MARQQVIDFNLPAGVDGGDGRVAVQHAHRRRAARLPDGPRPVAGGAGDAVRPHPAAQAVAAEGLAEVIDRALVEEPEIPVKTAAEFKGALENAM